MKIDNSIKSLASNGMAGRTAGKAGADGNKAPQIDSVNVQLSSLSEQVQTVSASDGVIDTAQIAEIKQAIRDGRFKINSGAIADRLLDSVKELINASHH
ncbi:Negative regulator of flagellin synthesis FlgM [Georgfuchsia toluolica]|uniref:Negative regulator of flagellin synthesis n=1 Tax=Georgfuchsia toluolica TaxID=424218 RepID=A0A916N129_9PROT|nr:flagellar biosynthesis anti-sigma factor FlgM [Georgfuchsia toluolica]CAG4882170.1 Negative regulator of flagellin synthesis FlgM [Georgfuchsia toluolica]